MPILMNSDTRAALGAGAAKCESRSLMLDKLPFFDERVADEKRVSLDLLLSNGREDLDQIRIQADYDATRPNPERAARGKAALEAMAILNGRGPAGAVASDPNRWLSLVPVCRKRELVLVTADRLAIGLANGVLENGGLSLHRYFGQPVIPGSALKGVASDAALQLPDVAPEFDTLFATAIPKATPSRQGAIGFLPAYPVSTQARLELDLATPHYRAYYSATGNPTATDTESPVPLPFPVVAKGEKFRFVLVCLSERFSQSEAKRLLELAEKALRHALTQRGVGAKVASGYGWFRDPSVVAPASEPTMKFISRATPRAPALDRWRGQGHTKGNFPVMLPELSAVENTADLEAALPQIVGVPAWNAFRKNNPYWQAFSSNKHGKAILDRITRKLK